jgi:hypothetical protein
VHWTIRRTAATLTLASLLVLLLWGAVERSAAAERLRRAASDAREVHLSRQIADRTAVLESQRRIYVERFRKLEVQIRQKDQEIARLRTLRALRGAAEPGPVPPGRGPDEGG